MTMLHALAVGVEIGEKEGFIDWLRRKEPDENVGMPALTTQCPLANWLQERFDNRDITVGVGMVFASGHGTATPHWADKFQEIAMDQCMRSMLDQGVYATSITALQALSIMDML